ncbi:glucokinase [Jatrophihabitans sp. GAS493]|uniref:ROK family protein n=1 Tax=Jatrophihabitans sp. GAS493 TaxID=1907575 RepID=UPI000BBF5FDA|nr:ROK family protein [Jatrophihabitans sp. GAS493]SOD74032.1 glucokinase [Jatrophihabitans sp. GAS493]
MTTVGALEIGGTHVAATAVETSTWQLIAPVQRVSLDPAASAAELLDGMGRCARSVQATDPALTLRSWGVAMPGPFDYERGVAQFTGVGKFESLHGIDVGAALQQVLGGSRTSVAVRFGNDADAFALGEYLAGAARGTARFAALTLGSGIGSCFLADGRPIAAGPDVPPGGEAHLIRSDGVPLEDVVSRRALRAAYRSATGVERDVKEIAERARAGDAAAALVLADYARGLGSALGPYLQRFRAESLVVGGSISGAWDLFDAAFRSTLADPALAIAISENSERSGLIGAASFA